MSNDIHTKQWDVILAYPNFNGCLMQWDKMAAILGPVSI